MAINRSLSQGRSYYRFAQGNCVFFGLCAKNLHLKKCGCSLSVTCDFLGKTSVDIVQSFHKFIKISALFCDFQVACHAVCKKQNGIICGSISINGNHVKGVFDVGT